MTNWISITDKLPECPNRKIGFSERVMLVVKDPNWEPDGIPEIDKLFPNRWLDRGRLFFPTSGGHVWLDLDQRPVEELGLLVTHWAYYPDLPGENHD